MRRRGEVIERAQQRRRYWRFWLRHPRQYKLSEQNRRAINLIGDGLVGDLLPDEDSINIWMPYERDGWEMRIYVGRSEPETPAVAPTEPGDET